MMGKGGGGEAVRKTKRTEVEKRQDLGGGGGLDLRLHRVVGGTAQQTSGHLQLLPRTPAQLGELRLELLHAACTHTNTHGVTDML